MRRIVLASLLVFTGPALADEAPPRAGIEMAVLKVQVEHLSAALDQLIGERTALARAVAEKAKLADEKLAEWWQNYARGLEAAKEPKKP